MAGKRGKGGTKLANCNYEDQIIEKFIFRGWSALQVFKWLNETVNFKVSYQTVVSYKENFLPKEGDKRVEEIRSNLESNRDKREEEVLRQLKDLENSLEYLARLQQNIEFLAEEKNFAKRKTTELREEISKIEEKIDQKKYDEDEDYRKDTDQERASLSIQAEGQVSKAIELIKRENDLIKTMQSIRIKLDMLLGERWDTKIRELINHVTSTMINVLNLFVRDSERSIAGAKAQAALNDLYRKYGVEHIQDIDSSGHTEDNTDN